MIVLRGRCIGGDADEGEDVASAVTLMMKIRYGPFLPQRSSGSRLMLRAGSISGYADEKKFKSP